MAATLLRWMVEHADRIVAGSGWLAALGMLLLWLEERAYTAQVKRWARAQRAWARTLEQACNHLYRELRRRSMGNERSRLPPRPSPATRAFTVRMPKGALWQRVTGLLPRFRRYDDDDDPD